MAFARSLGAGLASLLRRQEPPDYPFKSQLDSVKLRLICLCLAVRLKTAKSSQSMRLTFHGVQKYCFDYTGVTRDDVYNYMAALRGGLRTVSEEMESLAELWGDMYNFARLLFFIGVLIVAAVICFSEKIGYRRPVRVLQRAGVPLLLPEFSPIRYGESVVSLPHPVSCVCDKVTLCPSHSPDFQHSDMLFTMTAPMARSHTHPPHSRARMTRTHPPPLPRPRRPPPRRRPADFLRPRPRPRRRPPPPRTAVGIRQCP